MTTIRTRLKWINRRRGIDLLLVVGFFFAATLILRWRNEQFSGYGLQATYYENSNFSGKVLRRAVEHTIDFSDRQDALWQRAHLAVVWEGTIFLPRSGRYVLATESDDGSWVELDGQPVVSNGGIHGPELVEEVKRLTKGPHAIRIRYNQQGAGAKMSFMWTPPGREGGLEHVPATILFPGPPQEVKSSRAFAVPPRDFLAIILLGVMLLVTVLLLGRAWVSRGLRQLIEKRWARIDLALFVLLFVAGLSLRLWDISGAGQTWDEDVYFAGARSFVQNVLEGRWPSRYWDFNLEHPALAKWLYGPATLLADDYGPARAMAAIIGALVCGFIFLAGRDLINRRVGFLAGGLCLVMPHLVAHSKIVGLEVPSGLFFTLTTWFFFRGVQRQGNTGYYLAAGVCGGLALATRLTNLSLLPLFVLLYLVTHWSQIKEQRALPVSLTLSMVPVLLVVTFFAIWPYLWFNPLQHIGEMLSHWKPDDQLEYFLGRQQESPRYYFLLYFAMTMPALALAGLLLFFFRLLQHRNLGHFCLLLWLVCPFIVAFSPMQRDGVRYLYPALAAGTIATAAGLDWLASLVGRLLRRPQVTVPLVAVLGVGLGLYVLRASLAVHPYYLDYYSELVGGPRQVVQDRLFETAWWGEGIEEAARYLDRHAPAQARVKIMANPRHVIHLRSDLQWTDSMDADYILYNRLLNSPLKAPQHREVYVVRVDGAPLVWVYEKKPL